MKNNLLISLFLVLFIQSNAQTFEKSFYGGRASSFIADICTDSVDNLYVLINDELRNNDSSRYNSLSILAKLNSQGDTLFKKQLLPSNFNLSFVDSVNHLRLTLIENNGNGFTFYGSIRVSTPANHKFIIIKTSYDLVVQSYSLSTETFYDEIPISNSILRNDSQTVLFGVVSEFRRQVNFGLYVEIIEDSIFSINRLFDVDSLYTSVLNSAITDDSGNYYIAAGGYYYPPNYFTSTVQLLKFDSNFNFLKRVYVQFPILNNQTEIPEIFFEPATLQRLNDTSIIMAIAGSNNINDSKGDIHFLKYNNNLERLKAKRIVAPDTNLTNFFSNTFVIDTTSGNLYYGCIEREVILDRPLFSHDRTAFRVVKIDGDLNIKWDKFYQRNKTLELNVLDLDREGNIILAGMMNDSSIHDPFDLYAYIMKLDANGNVLSTGLFENLIENAYSLSVFPNPASSSINFRSNRGERLLKLEVFDMNGKLCYSEELASNKLQLAIESWNKSIYFYNVINENGVRYSGKFIKL